MRFLVMLSLAFYLVLGAAPAGADLRSEVEQDQDGNATVSVRSRSDGGGSTRSSGGTVSCRYYETRAHDSEALEYRPPDQMEEGGYYWVTCIDSATGDVVRSQYFVYDPGAPAMSGLGLAQSAMSSLTLGFPDPRTNPGIEHRQLPGIETWLWIDDADWQPVSATASVPGLSATVTATPLRVIWDMGDGSIPVVCEGPGTPYDPDVPPADQASDCTHRYQRRGSYTASATVTWVLRWSATDGDGGILDPVGRTTTFTMTVAERQAVGT